MKSGRIKPRKSVAKRTQGAPERWLDARKPFCENCGRAQRWMELHHVVKEQHVRRAGGDIYDPRNAMTLCCGAFSCHARHTARLHVIPMYKVPSAAIEFAADLFGPEAAYEYFVREYLAKAIPDHRVDHLIAPQVAP